MDRQTGQVRGEARGFVISNEEWATLKLRAEAACNYIEVQAREIELLRSQLAAAHRELMVLRRHTAQGEVASD